LVKKRPWKNHLHTTVLRVRKKVREKSGMNSALALGSDHNQLVVHKHNINI
jgi:hypothetical protein